MGWTDLEQVVYSAGSPKVLPDSNDCPLEAVFLHLILVYKEKFANNTEKSNQGQTVKCFIA